MKALSLLLAASVVAAACFPPLHAQELDATPVRLLYQSKQRVFDVRAFEDGLPKLEPERIVEGAETSPETENQWWVEGELPVDVVWAQPLEFFELKRERQAWKERGSPPAYEVSFRHERDSFPPWPDEEASQTLIVYGWAADGEVEEVTVFVRDPQEGYERVQRRLEVPEARSHGGLYVWLVKDGRLVKRAEVGKLDPAAFPLSELGDRDATRIARASKRNGFTALMMSSLYGRADWVEHQVEAKAKLDKTGEWDRSALALAAMTGREDVVELLLEAGADPLAMDIYLRIPLNHAVNGGHMAVAEQLLPYKPKRRNRDFFHITAFNTAREEGYDELAALLAVPEVLEAVPKGGRGALALSAFAQEMPELGFHLCREFGLESGYARDGYGVLHAVAPYADVALLERAREWGADLRGETKEGFRPVDMAVGTGNVEAICWFLDNGGNPERSQETVDPVYHAIAKAQVESVACLIDYGFDMNRERREGITPLMQALALRHGEIARLIVEAGGVWDLDSPLFDVCLVRAIELDLAEALARAMEQGLDTHRLLFESVNLRDVADFYDSPRALAMLAEQELPESKLVDSSQWTAGPKLLSREEIEYPYDLQKLYGDRNFKIKAVLGVHGRPILVDYYDDEPEEIRQLFEASFAAWVFEPAQAGDGPVAAQIAFDVPLKAPLSDENVYDFSGLEVKPRPLDQVEPNYPFFLQQMGVEGWVIVEFIIDTNGKVVRARAHAASHDQFKQPAIESILKSTFSPGMENGRPVATRVRQRIEFRL